MAQSKELVDNNQTSTIAKPQSRIPQSKKQDFLDAFVRCRRVSDAAEAVGIDRCTPYHWKASDPDFAQQMDAAYRKAGDYYLAKIDERIESEKNADILLMFMTKRYHPEFRDNPQFTPTTQDNRQFNIVIANGTDDTKNKLSQLLAGNE